MSIHSDCFYNNDGSFDTDNLSTWLYFDISWYSSAFWTGRALLLHPLLLFVRLWCCFQTTDRGGICYFKVRYFWQSPSAAIINAATYYTVWSFAIVSDPFWFRKACLLAKLCFQLGTFINLRKLNPNTIMILTCIVMPALFEWYNIHLWCNYNCR